MSDLHEMVGDEVMRVLEDGVTANEVAARILAAVREALLAPATVRAGARAITSDPAFADNTWVDDARNTLTAALDAAGLGGDGHE